MRRRLMFRALASAVALAVFFCVVSAAAAERTWDDELGRYLTAEELGHEELFLPVDEAVALMFPKSDRVRREALSLSPEQKAVIQDRIGWKFPEVSFEVFIGESNGTRDGYAVIQNTIGKHKHMTYMVGVDPRGRVSNVELLVYRESRGSEVGRKRFNYQYEGKDLSDPIRINRDIINISGATMSVRSMSAGVKRVLVLVDELYLKPLGLNHKAAPAGRRKKGFWSSLLGD